MSFPEIGSDHARELANKSSQLDFEAQPTHFHRHFKTHDILNMWVSDDNKYFIGFIDINLDGDCRFG